MTLIEEFRSCWLIATFGCILYLAGTSVLFWNEGRAVHNHMALNEALENAVSLSLHEEIESIYEGKIVHISGPIIIEEPLLAPDYGIQVLAVKLRRRVQMYQWVEESVEHNYGESVDSIYANGGSYYYTREWRDKLIDSRSFHTQTGHRNPEYFPIESETQLADNVFIGRYELGTEIKVKFNNYVELTSDTRPDDPDIKLHLGMYYYSNDIFNPEIGDIRVLFTAAGQEGEIYTIVGKLQGRKIVPFKATRGDEVILAYPGELGLSEVFKREHHAQRLTDWGFRFMGWILVFFGVTCTSKLLSIILSRIRILSSLAPDPQYPVGANIMLSLSFALIIASVAWVLHRPMVGAGLLFAAASPFLWCARGVTNYEQVITSN